MKVAILNTKETLRARYLLESFEKGVRQHGDETRWANSHTDYEDVIRWCDVGLQVCYPNLHKSSDKKAHVVGQFRVQANDLAYKLGKRIITIDTGFIRNQSDYELDVAASTRRHKVLFDMDNRDTYEAVLKDIYYEVGFDGIKRRADYCVRKAPEDRWRDLNVEMRPWRTDGDHILLIGQTLFGLSSQKVNIYDWYRLAVKRIRAQTNRLIVFRHHPRLVKIRAEGSRLDKDRREITKALGSPKGFEWSQGWTMADDLKNAWCAVNYTSNAGVQAVLKGVPVFAGSDGNMAWEVANQDVKMVNIESPSFPERKQWVYNLAYAQWNVAEMIEGKPWQHLRHHATEKPKRNWRED